MAAFMRTSFFVLLSFLGLNAIVRTTSPTLHTQNIILLPLVCLSFLILAGKRSLLASLYKSHALSSSTINLSQLWFESLSFPLLYLYLGRPNLSLIVNPLSEHTEFDLIPDILATSIYSLSLLLMTQEATSLSAKKGEGLLRHA
jgi:hypothetical protein